MDINEVRNQIKERAVKSFYTFTGDELEVMWIYIREIAKAKNQQVSVVDQLSDVYQKLSAKSLISKSFCYVVRDDKDLMTNEELWGKSWDDIGQNTVIHLITAVDKRTKFYKSIKNSLVEFNPLSEQLLTTYVQRKFPMSTNNCLRLIRICDSSYGRILLELDKINNWRESFIKDKPEPIPFEGAFLRLANSGDIYRPPADALFDFVGAVLDRQPHRAFQLLRESYECGESTMVLLSVLYTNLKQLLQVQSCTSQDVSKATGLTQWQVKCARDHIKGQWRIGELVKFLRDVRESEVGIKTGAVEESVAVEIALLKNF